jgi:hypothetical protein
MAIQNFGSGGGGFQLSPGINVSEIDLTTVVPSVDSTSAAFAGVFRWGPANERILVTSENDLVARFGKPTNDNAETFFSAANFLSYSNSLYVVRALQSTQFAAVGSSNGNNTPSAARTIENNDDYETKATSSEWRTGNSQFVARWAGAIGNSLRVSVCENEAQFSSVTNLRTLTYTFNGGDEEGNTAVFDGANTGFSLTVGQNAGRITLDGGPTSSGRNGDYADQSDIIEFVTATANKFAIGDYFIVGTGPTQALQITGKTLSLNTAETVGFIDLTFDQPLKLASNIQSNTVGRYWEYYNVFDAAPGRSEYVTAYGNTALQTANTAEQKDEIHIVVIDEDGEFTGTQGAVVEVWPSLSRATDAKNSDGTSNYYKTVLAGRSQFVWAAADRTGAVSNTAINIRTSTNLAPLSLSLSGAVDVPESNISFAAIASAYDQFVSPEDVDIALMITGTSKGDVNAAQKVNYLIDNIAEVRKDIVVFASPEKDDVVNAQDPVASTVGFRDNVRSSSYAVMDSGYKYQYDKYNDVYRWIPLNGDMAGVCVRTDTTRDPWFSPAGTTRGQIKNSLKLAFNPNKAQRDQLYKKGINPVISERGEGTFLFGDKTLLARSSAFDRINVRRLFIVLEKAISRAAKSQLFEFNDEFTRTQFVSIVEPYLRDVQGRRGITEFRVVCDETNNTPEVIDSNRFVGDIYIKPARAINFIQLNFVAVRSGVAFSEITG